MQFSEKVETFLGLHRKNSVRAYKATFKLYGSDPEKATLSSIVKFLKDLRANDRSDATLRRHANAFKSFFNFLLNTGEIDKNPCAGLKYVFPRRQNVQVRPTAYVTWPTMRLVRKTFDTRTREGIRNDAIIAILFAGGLRRSELLALNCGDIQFNDKSEAALVLASTKSGKRQAQNLPEWASRSVSRYLIQRHQEGAVEGDPFIVSYRGRSGRRCSEKTLWRWFTAWFKAVGVKAAPHSARAASATRLHEIGASPKAIQIHLRHATVQSIDPYIKNYDEKTLNPGRMLEP